MQYGFREKRSCETQLLEFVHDLACNMQGGGQTDVLIMDFSKAFDKVGHQCLIKKLDYYGVCDKTSDWIQAFLANRTLQVIVKGKFSDIAQVQSGVPQGSVLGPCLSLFYINDLPDNLSSTVRLFADDTLLYLAVESQSDTNSLQKDLYELENWENMWLMEFTTDKCQVLRVTHKRDPLYHEYTLHGKTLESVDSAKYLGVTISLDLRWNQHISNIVTKGNQTLGFLRRNLRINSPELKSTAHKNFVWPTVEYASSVWDPYTKQNSDRIEMVQRRAARYVLNCYERSASVTEMLKQLDWETLELCRKKARLIMLYKMHCNLVEIAQQKYLEPTGCSSRHMHKFSYKVMASKTITYMYIHSSPIQSGIGIISEPS